MTTQTASTPCLRSAADHLDVELDVFPGQDAGRVKQDQLARQQSCFAAKAATFLLKSQRGGHIDAVGNDRAARFLEAGHLAEFLAPHLGHRHVGGAKIEGRKILARHVHVMHPVDEAGAGHLPADLRQGFG